MRIGVTTIFLFIHSVLFSQDLVINSFNKAINVNSYLSYYLDDEKSKTIDEISSLSTGYFVKIKPEGLRLPVTDAQLWIKFSCKSNLNTPEEFILDFIDPSLYSIELYEQLADGTYKVSRTGTGVSQEDKSIKGNRNSLKIELHPQTRKQFFLKIYSSNNMTISSQLMNDEMAISRNIDERTFIGLFYGALIILFLYNILLYFTLKYRVFLLNGIYTFFVGLFTGAADGFTPQYFFFLVEWTNGYQDIISAAGTNIVGLLFMRDFLRIKHWSTNYDKIIKWFVYGILGTLTVTLLIQLSATFMYLSFVGLLVLLVMIIFGVIAVRTSVPQSKYFLAAYIVFGVFIVFFILSLLRLIPYGFMVKYSIHFGYLLCISILSYGLSVKIYEIYLSLLRKEKEKQALVKKKNEELEEKVRERTKDIQEKEINLRSILDNYDNSIWLIDRDYKLIDFNRVFFEEWKMAYKLEVKVGESILDKIPDEATREIWRKRYDSALQNERAVYRDTYYLGEEEHHYEIHVFPISYNREVTGISFFSKDVTVRVNAQKQLIERNDSLVKVNRELDSFVYSASHDLKAPLASILGLVNLVKDEEDATTRQQYYGMMKRSVERLDQFIKDIIDYSRNARVQVNAEKIDLKLLIHNVFEDLKYIEGAEEIEKNIMVEKGLSVFSDPIRLRVVVRNILSNAIKYGCSQREIKQIDIKAQRSNNTLKMSIKDYGPGIPEDQKGKIFEMFYRAHESKSGTGLGLYIVKETLDKLGGSVEVISAPDEGAEFVVKVPSEPTDQ